MISKTTSHGNDGDVMQADAGYSANQQRELYDDVISMNHRQLFWPAKFLRASSTLAHLPLLFWLVSDLRPVRSATLNINTGAAHFGVCQAIEKTGTETTCLGFGDWNGVGIPQDIANYNAEHYGEFSHLADASHEVALRRVRKASLDLLVVGGPLTTEIIAALTQVWSQRMSRRGVMVLLGLDTLQDKAEAQLEQWCSGKPYVQFSSNGGVLVIRLGQADAPQLMRLAQLDPNSEKFLTVERIFSQLGASQVNAFLAREKSEWSGEVSAKLQKAEQAKIAVETAYVEQTKELERLQDLCDTAQARVDRYEGELQDIRSALNVARAERAPWQDSDALVAQLTDLTEARQLRDEQLATERAEYADQVARRDAELLNLIELLDRESDQRILASEVNSGLQRAFKHEQQRHELDIQSLTKVLREIEERSIQRNEMLKSQERQQSNTVAQLEDVQQTLAIRTREAKAIAEQIHSSEVITAQLHTTIEQNETERAKLQKHLDHLQAELIQTRLERDKEEIRCKTMLEKFNSVEQELAETQADLTQKLTVAQTKIRSQDKTLLTLQAQLNELQEHCESLEKANTELMQSTSWRVTAPLRQATSAIRKKK